ncbi:MAG: tRNA dihydrouridine synthase DusB [Planctomycetota bacterium]|nr:tRNA dihydrouridine synthase DusB [Planctomycetota bacterium]
MGREPQSIGLGYSLGEISIRHGLALAPMAGNTNLAYRRLCRKFGAELTTTEMVSAKALQYADKKTQALLARGEDETPVAAQVFGSEPESLGLAARAIEARGFQVLDFNMGCPVPKITGGGGGSALLRDAERAAACVTAMVGATSLPVTVKIRTGWSDEEKDPAGFAKVMEDAGAQAITVHGRTRGQKYTGTCDLESIAAVVQAVSIPVIGNGDILDLDSAKKMVETGVQGMAIGRGALGSPWIFSQISAWADGLPVPPPPALAERAALLLELGEGVVDIHGEHRGMRIMRRLAADFFRGVTGAPQLRNDCRGLENLLQLEELARRLEQTSLHRV